MMDAYKVVVKIYVSILPLQLWSRFARGIGDLCVDSRFFAHDVDSQVKFAGWESKEFTWEKGDASY
jgi:hypothetical protein